jgi:hypothetical protein
MMNCDKEDGEVGPCHFFFFKYFVCCPDKNLPSPPTPFSQDYLFGYEKSAIFLQNFVINSVGSDYLFFCIFQVKITFLQNLTTENFNQKNKNIAPPNKAK